jgi:imidazolonepropionase-like amidohydrolase
MASGGDMTPRSNRRATQYSDAEFETAVKAAHRLSLPVVAHCNATDAIRQAAQFGADTIAHCNWLGAEDGTIKYDKDIAKSILDNGTYLDLNIAGTLNSYVTGDGFAMRSDFGFANRWELHADLRVKGAKIILTSDEFGGQTCQFPSLIARVIAESGLDPTEAIFRTTSLPAFALNISHETGSIIPGKNADLVLLEGDLLSDSKSLTRATTVWNRGAVFTSENQERL